MANATEAGAAAHETAAGQHTHIDDEFFEVTMLLTFLLATWKDRACEPMCWESLQICFPHQDHEEHRLDHLQWRGAWA